MLYAASTICFLLVPIVCALTVLFTGSKYASKIKNWRKFSFKVFTVSLLLSSWALVFQVVNVLSMANPPSFLDIGILTIELVLFSIFFLSVNIFNRQYR